MIGVKAGLFVWVMDALKGYLPVLVAHYMLLPMLEPVPTAGAPVAQWWLAAVAVAAILGHCFSPYLRLTGGRGVSTSLGVIIGLDWRAGALCFVIWIIIVALTRYISLSSMIATSSAALILYLFSAPIPHIAATATIALIVIIRHIPNIQRLCNGTERKIGQKEPAAPESETAS